MASFQQQYQELILDLILTREEAGGTLSTETEVGFISRLDDLWWKMTDEEQESVAAWLRGPVDAPYDLGLVDVLAGTGTLPRRSAA